MNFNTLTSTSQYIVLLFLLFTGAQTVLGQSTSLDLTPKTIKVNGANLHYLEKGEGEAVVLVHGSLGDLDAFKTQINPFAESYRVIAYSRRFHPPNLPSQKGDIYSMQQHVDDLATLIKELEKGPVHLVGHSYGAYIVLAIAIQNPGLVRSLILAEPPVFPMLSLTQTGSAVLDSWITHVIKDSKSAFEQGNDEEGLRRFFDGIWGTGSFDKMPVEQRQYLTDVHAPVFSLEMRTPLADYMLTISCEQVSNLDHSVLLLTGEKSPSLFPLINTQLEHCLEEISHTMIPESGHGMQFDNPEFFNKTVLEFLAKH